MKKILNRIGNGFKKLKTSRKFKSIITAILVVVMIIDVNPFFLKAGRESLVYKFENGVQHPFAFDNNHNSYSYYSISWMGGHVAYCMDYDIKNPPNGTGLQYLKNVNSNKVVAVLMNGYPNKTAAQMGLSNNQEAYLATQMAVWAAVNGTSETKGLNFDINKLQPNVKYNSEYKDMLSKTKKVANQLVSKTYTEGKFILDGKNAKVNYDYNDTQISIGPYKPTITGYSSLNNVTVSISGQPAGTLIVDKNGKQKTTFSKDEGIYILVNKKEPASSLKITATGKANKYVGVVYGKGSWQNFLFLDTEQVNVSSEATATWEESKGTVKIVKVDQDSNPIQGAEFTLSDSNGKQIESGKTDINGILQFNKLDLGGYTVTETSVPDGYIIQKSTYDAVVKRNQTSVVNVQNTKVKGVLQVTKIEKVAKTPIPGVVFEIYDESGNVVDKMTTDQNGIATSSELPKGNYSYKEVSAPDGYIKDNATRSFFIAEKINVVRETITNEKIVGKLNITKISDDGEKLLEGAEFAVYDANKNQITTLTTDKDGKAVSIDLAKGIYTFKEIKAPLGYDPDTKEYTFKIETLNQVVEQTIINNRIYGKLKIQKVDENDNSISDVKFKIIDENNKEVVTVTTDVNGIAVVENLPVGKYKYKEIDTPYLYVLDEKEYEFEITSEEREVIVKAVNERAKGILKIIKIDKDSKEAIPNAKFDIIDKTNNDIVDSIVTDENGVARTKALATGEYYYQEVEVPEEYILDGNKYEVKIKKNNQMVDEKVSNEHKKLPVTGGFLSTDVTIVLIVTSTSVIAFVIYKIIKNRNNNPEHPDDDFYMPNAHTPNDSNSYVESINKEADYNDQIDEKSYEENLNNNEIDIENSNEEENNNLNAEVKEEKEESINIDSITSDNIANKEDLQNDVEFLDEDDEMLDLTPNYNNKNEDINE